MGNSHEIIIHEHSLPFLVKRYKTILLNCHTYPKVLRVIGTLLMMWAMRGEKLNF